MARLIKRLGAVALLGAVYVFSAHAATPQVSARLDRLVFSRLDELGIPPSDLCTDEVFVRRVFLDVIGTLPTAEEARLFMQSSSPNKRTELIDDLLDRPEYADYWAMKWCDLLRVKAEFPSRLWPNAVQAYARWIRTSLHENMPYDEFVKALLTSSGSNFRVAPVNFYRAMPQRTPEAIAQTVALTFMGMRTDHWNPEKLQGMAAFFGQVGYKGTAEWKEEIVYFDPSGTYTNAQTGTPFPARLPDGKEVDLSGKGDPRIVFSNWLVDSNVFARNIVNRIWYWLLGRGIIHEPDDIREDNPPQNAELLAFLCEELVRSGYDLKHMYRVILNSKTYQLSAVHNEGNRQDDLNFSRYLVRRLDAEVLIDAICRITDTTESYHSEIPEPFTYIPETQRSIKLADGSITSPFLDLFGRPPRDTGYESERNNVPSSAQALHLLNSTHIQKKLAGSRELLGMYTVAAAKEKRGKGAGKPRTMYLPIDETIENIYLTVLSRYPTAQELRTANAYYDRPGAKRYECSVDIAWALINSTEFLFRH